MRVNPVGAKSSGEARRCPSSVTEVSTAETSRITRGRKPYPPKAARLARSVTSSSAPPSM